MLTPFQLFERGNKELRNTNMKGFKWSKHKDTKRELMCAVCRTIFRVYPHRINVAKYCSRMCRNQAYSFNPVYHRKHTVEARKKIAFAKMGDKNPSWCGGISRERHFNAASKAWRKAVFERDNYTCQMCGQKGGRLEADHIKSWSLYPELRYELSNGRTLCVDCHKQTPTYGYKSRRDLNYANTR